MKPRLLLLMMFALICARSQPTLAKKAPPPPAGDETAAPDEVTAEEDDKIVDPKRKAMEEKFIRTLSGATLVGSFTQEQKGDAPAEEDAKDPPAQEKYIISKVTKLRGDYFLFAARMQFGGKDVTVPLMLPVKWAGDTPVITVTNVGIPGLGTYTARVMIYDDQYAGTWNGGDYGGHLWGKIVPGEADAGGQGKIPPPNPEPESTR